MSAKKLVSKKFSPTRYCIFYCVCEKNIFFLYIFPFQFGKIVLVYCYNKRRWKENPSWQKNSVNF